MTEVLKIENLCKTYPSFSLKDVSFSIKPGTIMGFIGRNGAGKTTTLKAIMNLIHYEKGKITVFDKDMIEHELENKQKIGFALSEINYYPNISLKTLIKVTSKFYKSFDYKYFEEVRKLFNLDLNKKIEELSSGMKVKYSLSLALSSKAELLILDEPTSGLDPVSRDEVLDIFKNIVKDSNRSILFSTHITSDLDKCANDITYIHDGEIIFSGTKEDFINSYFYIVDKSKNKNLINEYISYKEQDSYIEGLIISNKKKIFDNKDIEIKKPDLEQIMIFIERSKNNVDFTL